MRVNNMRDIKVNLNWETSFDTIAEAEEFLKAVANVHNQMYGADVAYKKLIEDGKYEGAVNVITVEFTTISRKDPKVFKAGDVVVILGVDPESPDSKGKVDFVDEMTQLIYVSNMSMKFKGSTSRFFKAEELEHV